MRLKRWALLLFILLALPLCALAEETSAGRVLLIGVDEFASRPSAYPSSTNNVYAMQELFQNSSMTLEALLVPSAPVTSAQELTGLIRETFGAAKANDVSYLYLSTHGVYEPESGEPPRLLLSDGLVEGSITPRQLEAAFEGRRSAGG